MERSKERFGGGRARPEGGQKINRSGRACDSFMILGAGLCPFRRRIGCRDQFRKIKRPEQVVPTVENSDVRAIKLISRASQEVAIPIVHINQLMRSVMDSVDKDLRV